MPRNIDDVILPERRKSIRNIPIPEGRRKSDRATVPVRKAPNRMAELKSELSEASAEASSLKMPPVKRYRTNKKRIWMIGGVAVAFLLFTILSMMSGATLAYTPKSLPLNFTNEIYSAAKTGEGELLYSVVKLSGDKGKSVTVSGEQQVSRKASGTIIVYNDSTEAQRLIENTRFESVAGKVYRIVQAINVPAKKTVSGVSTLGTLEVTVFADVAGEAYNAAPTDFTVPGLKGTPRFSVIYARSKGALTGGLVGMEKVVGESDLLKARSELRATLTEELMTKAQAEVPVDFILFPTLSSVTFEDLPQTSGGAGKSASVNLRGHLYGIMFKRSDLSRELSKNKAALTAAEQVELNSFQGLKFSFSGTPPTELLPINKISFKVEGSALVVWRTDEVALKSDLSGKPKKEVSSILKNYPTIASATATLRPFWKTKFPTEAGKITIKKSKVE